MNNQTNYLVIGGTGKTGRKVVEGLQKAGQSVRIGSRSATPSFQWGDPSTWPAALEGIDRMYVVYYPDLAVPGAYEAISGLMEEAKKAGVEKVVLLSGKGETEAERCEQVVAKSGMNYTLVRASWFSQNFSEYFFLDPILAGHVALPMADAQIPFVDTTDIAEVVLEALQDDAHNGKTYEITGPETLSFEEAVKVIGESSGREIAFQSITLDQYTEGMKAAGVPDDVVWLIGYLFQHVLTKAENQYVSHDIEKVLGRKATSFNDFAREAAKTGVWNQSLPQTI
ncbi:MAG: NmrA family NAD(P)-binding protein [Bacteroidota bacterium]